jgi:aminoglycoside phosphotransferase (APT) family kinase protein
MRGSNLSTSSQHFVLTRTKLLLPPDIHGLRAVAMDQFYDSPISPSYYFANAPQARTRREATRYYLTSAAFVEPCPVLSSSEIVIHRITHPASIESSIDRQVVLQTDNAIRKSVRVPLSDLRAEKETLELVRANTSIPVPRVYQHYTTAEFEHLVMERMPGTTLEAAWPTLETSDKEDIADEVVSFLGELRALRSPYIQAALLHRRPLRSGLVGTPDFNSERFSQLPSNEYISAYVQSRAASAQPQLNLYTHGDLDWSNILVNDNKVSGIIDWESSGYFPDYWEWVTLKRSAEAQKPNSWPQLLASRLGSSDSAKWTGMWELEQLHKALGQYAQWALTPEDREVNRTRGWVKVTSIVGQDCMPPPVDYSVSSRHPWWLEKSN